MQRRQQKDYVIGLISGKVVSQRDIEGKLIKVFKPTVHNKYPTLSRLMDQKSERLTEDDIMVGENLRGRHLRIDRSWFSKSRKEAAELKRVKNAHKKEMRRAGFNPNTRLNISEPQILRQA